MAVKPIFVVQKHQARSLHYDFRLEINGILKSWAIPKGFTLHSDEKRLAILTIDHPLEYAEFEGSIPEGTYGAGKVLIWDKGCYYSLDDPHHFNQTDIECQIDQGKLLFYLEGTKLKGKFALILSDPTHKQWMIMKLCDSESKDEGDILQEQPLSVISGKSIEDL